MMKILNPKNYEFLWTGSDLNFFFISYWLNKEYKKRNTLLIFDHKKKEIYFFLSKRTIKRLSEFGLLFIKKYFPFWKKKVKEKIKEAQKIFKEVKNKKFSLLSNFNLIKDFLSKIKFYQSIGELYFFTEFFLYKKIERMIEENPKRYRFFLLRIKEMQKVKFKLREVINEFWFKEGIFKKYIEEIQRRTKKQDLYWFSYKEIVEILKGKKIKKSNREKRDWVLTKVTGWKMIIGKKATKILNDFKNYHFKKAITEIKGQIANKGFYKGKVKIIKPILEEKIEKEISKVKKNDILVVSSTGPELIRACRKAGAIITDQGGITSHAAIVSRELGIPCIVGTKIATKVLKDGDLVEVDANKGIVKILKRKE